MTITSTTTLSPSRLIAAEIRAEAARQGVSNRELGTRMGVSYAWVNRRISMGADVDLTIEEAVRFADALGVGIARLLSSWLPRLDSNQQPSGYLSSQVSAPETVVIAGREWVLTA